MGTVDVLIGRQPIFDGQGRVYAYEVLLRSRGRDIAADGEGPEPHESLLALMDTGIDRLVGRHNLHLKLTSDLLIGNHWEVLPPERTVLIVDPPDVTSKEALDACSRAVEEGFNISVDHQAFDDGNAELLALANFIRLDVRDLDKWWVDQVVGYCRDAEQSALAINIDLRQSLEECSEMGIELFQGHLLSVPQLVKGRKLEPSRISKVRLSVRLLDSEADIKELEGIIRLDPAMTRQILNLASSGSVSGTRSTVKNLHEALVLAGWRRLQSWVSMLLMADKGPSSEEEVATALVRARMCELIARATTPALAEAAYTAGMLSSFDLLLHVGLPTALESMPIDQDLRDSVINHKGQVGSILADVIDFQLGRNDLARRCGVDELVLQRALAEAILWAVDATEAITLPPEDSSGG